MFATITYMATKKTTPKKRTAAAKAVEPTVVGTKKKWSFTRIFPWLLVVGGTIGLLSAIILTIEKVHLLKNPSASLSCDLNPIIACGSVINTPQASAFGFPNPIIGIAGFAIVITVGMAILAGATFKRWFWLGLQAGTIFGVCFVTWLQYQSIYNIGALCPYCMVVWSVTIPIFIYTLLYNIREKHIVLPSGLQSVGRFFGKYHVEILVTWYLLIILAILEHFWYYWSTVI